MNTKVFGALAQASKTDEGTMYRHGDRQHTGGRTALQQGRDVNK